MGCALDRIDHALAFLGPQVAAEVSRLISEASCLDTAQVSIDLEQLARKHMVYRVCAAVNGEPRLMVVKRLDPDVAHRNRLVAERWLPAIGLEAAAPRLLGAVATSRVEFVWHIYEDLGGIALNERHSDRECVSGAVDLIAELHTQAAGHPFICECRRDGRDHGIHYFSTNVSDALNLLGALRPPAVRLSRQQAGVRDQLRRRLEQLLADAPRRARLMAEAGGPETMLHGDLWTTNVIVVDAEDRVSVRLIDWDHAGAGPICYDLSTFLYRFERAQRPWILNRYRKAVARAGWRLPPVPELNVLCDTAECARYARRVREVRKPHHLAGHRPPKRRGCVGVHRACWHRGVVRGAGAGAR
jgi:hypothetical protein